MAGRIPIEDVTPCVACGRYPAKAVVGELVPISAVSYREGHGALGCNVVWQGPDGRARPFTRMQPGEPGLDRWHAGIKPGLAGRSTVAIEAIRADELPLFERVSPALDLVELMWEYPVREQVSSTSTYALWVDRKRALFSAWYEFFPRSEGAAVGPHGEPVTHGTFATAAKRLRGVADMGFDILYLPPIHPIGRVNRKGRNNALVATKGDV